MTPPAIDVTDLSFRYPDGTIALDHVNLRVDAGEHVAAGADAVSKPLAAIGSEVERHGESTSGHMAQLESALG